MIRLLGLYREREYSPGRHQSNDAQLLEQVADRLRARGLLVELVSIEQAAARRNGVALVFSMCQGRSALGELGLWEHRGMSVINSPRAALNTYRDRLPQLMRRAGVAFPPTTIVPTDGLPVRGLDIDGGVWLKRGDVHASVSADVQRIESLGTLAVGLAEFASRGIALAAIQAHRDGDEIKFYGVTGGRFFHWFNSGVSRGYPLDRSELSQLANRAARAAGLDVFGGDVIVSPAGDLTLIDLNDWPSFAPCRDGAAEAIADHLTRRVHAAWNPGLVSSANESAV